MNPDDGIALRQAKIAELGIEAAFDWFVAQTDIPGTPSWSHQEPGGAREITDKDRAACRRMERP